VDTGAALSGACSVRRAVPPRLVCAKLFGDVKEALDAVQRQPALHYLRLGVQEAALEARTDRGDGNAGLGQRGARLG
jgi:hypothetical protein